VELLLRPEVAGLWSEGLPREGEALASSGRGGLLRVESPLGPALVRTYRRGGLLRALLPDAFFSPGRALAEVAALELLEGLDLAPDVFGLELKGGALQRMRIAVREVPGARNLLELGAAESPAMRMRALGRAVGEAVAAMHQAGVAHRDLNVANVLVADEGVRLIDFDGATVHPDGVPLPRRRREVLRLCRSLDKWAATAATPAAVRAAFLRAALPLGERRSMLDEGRRQHARRVAAGKVGLPPKG
jgi:3-deoxy-D-manno-octulosonic acid kinase